MKSDKCSKHNVSVTYKCHCLTTVAEKRTIYRYELQKSEFELSLVVVESSKLSFWGFALRMINLFLRWIITMADVIACNTNLKRTKTLHKNDLARTITILPLQSREYLGSKKTSFIVRERLSLHVVIPFMPMVIDMIDWVPNKGHTKCNFVGSDEMTR